MGQRFWRFPPVNAKREISVNQKSRARHSILSPEADFASPPLPRSRRNVRSFHALGRLTAPTSLCTKRYWFEEGFERGARKHSHLRMQQRTQKSPSRNQMLRANYPRIAKLQRVVKFRFRIQIIRTDGLTFRWSSTSLRIFLARKWCCTGVSETPARSRSSSTSAAATDGRRTRNVRFALGRLRPYV
ncbi:hypothetical protein CA54_38710 [Symmachiella macrocystis]|uniref:Uncharacterized protein n=1 Tax=Symmachiella macrocystis TaxID=2527985 RepID=A0A5C6BBK5_9PLAN|nr:hypothetical protein CA54_38710 [Symmachiella macrocystis]